MEEELGILVDVNAEVLPEQKTQQFSQHIHVPKRPCHGYAGSTLHLVILVMVDDDHC